MLRVPIASQFSLFHQLSAARGWVDPKLLIPSHSSSHGFAATQRLSLKCRAGCTLHICALSHV